MKTVTTKPRKEECARGTGDVKYCSTEGCTNQAINSGVCILHGAEKRVRKICSNEDCDNQARKGGVCNLHGAKNEAKRKTLVMMREQTRSVNPK